MLFLKKNNNNNKKKTGERTIHCIDSLKFLEFTFLHCTSQSCFILRINSEGKSIQPVNIRISSCESKIRFKSCEYSSDKINITICSKKIKKKRQVKRNTKIREEGILGNVNEQIFSYRFLSFKKQL